jgi:hypothetical protein
MILNSLFNLIYEKKVNQDTYIWFIEYQINRQLITTKQNRFPKQQKNKIDREITKINLITIISVLFSVLLKEDLVMMMPLLLRMFEAKLDWLFQVQHVR